ncbi:MAG: nucleoside-triphosphatase [Oscillospiraceae bacterium]|nr:nucleoside-triphosphatase [Oscillospiraceae bacterium]
MHIFLTGDIRVGKTTIIQRFLAHTGLSADGFVTYWKADNDGSRNLYISPCSTNSHFNDGHRIVHDVGKRPFSPENMASVFDIYGSEMLHASGKHNIIVMDELGFFESKAFVFQRAVMQHIYGDVPILGAIKPKQTEFLNTIRAHPNVDVREVTMENREAILTWLLERI